MVKARPAKNSSKDIFVLWLAGEWKGQRLALPDVCPREAVRRTIKAIAPADGKGKEGLPWALPCGA